MPTILDEILKNIPDADRNISESCFEGANIILYTKNKEFFLNQNNIIRNIVNTIKKRIELRPDPSVCLEMEKAEELIRKIIPEDAKIGDIKFDNSRSIVVIEAEKPGIAIGKQGEVLKEIKRQTLWIPNITRMPPLKSKIVDNIRAVLFQESDYRRKFLNKVGHRIYDGWLRDRRNEWVRLTFLGGGRQVGRSCIFLQTQESRILLDCGINIAVQDQNAYPHFDIPEFKIEELDAIVLSHAHLDHSGFIPYIYKMGYRGPVYCTEPTRDISALLALDFIGVAFKQAKKTLFDIEDVKEMVKHTITLDWEEVTDITPDMRLTLYNSGHILGSSMCHLHIGNGLHNLVYSLDWKTPVVILDKEENVEFKPIGELVDNIFYKYPDLVNKRNGYEEIDNIENLKTISFNPETYKTEIKNITGLIRHPINENLYEIKTATGRSAIVTKSHSVFSFLDGGVMPVRVSDLNVGDFIIGPKLVPNSNKIPIINLFKYRDKLRIRVENKKFLNKIIKYHLKDFSKLKENDKREALNWIIDHYKRSMYKKDIVEKYKVHSRRIDRVFRTLNIEYHPRVKHTLPNKFIITEDFARFIGYYVSEGSIRKNSQTIEITNYSSDILEDCRRIIKSTFGIESDLREMDGALLAHSKQLKYLIKNILNCGGDAYSKRVPKQILFSDKKIMRSFLYGYFSGDGGIRARAESREISASSKNPLLIQDIVFMLLQFGIVPTLQYNSYTRMYAAYIYNAEKIKDFLNEIGIHNNSLNKLKLAIMNTKKKASFDLRIPILALSKKAQLSLSSSPYKTAKTCGIDVLRNKFNLNEKVVNSDFMFDQIISIKRVEPTGKFVYDLKIEGFENFLGGNGFLFLHNSGDYKFLRTKILDPAVTNFPRLETFITESTYGGKDDVLGSRKDAELELIRIVKETIGNGGKVLIPVLGVGRAQEIMLIVEEAVRNSQLEKFPIYVHGMVWDVTAIHTAYPDYLNSNLRKAIFHKDQNPFLSDIFYKVGSKKEQDQVIEESGPCLIIATAGMLNAGASLEYFKRMADNPKNAIIFVSYLAEGTIGRKVQNGEKEITLMDNDKPEVIKVNLNHYTLSSLSGHAGRNELIRYVYSLNPKPKRIIINHGESSKCLDLASSLHKMARIETSAPKNLETVRVR